MKIKDIIVITALLTFAFIITIETIVQNFLM
jgi:hypothetical protein